MANWVLQLNEELRQARETLTRQKELLLSIQKAILPERVPSVPGLDVALHFSPADDVGGDFYDIRPAGPEKWSITIADACGHGLGAATVMALAYALGALWHHHAPPRSLSASLCEINQLLARYLANTDRFATAFTSIYDARSRKLTYASAGHPPPRLIRNGEVLRLDAVNALPLGVAEATVYYESAVCLSPGDRLVLFTDGVTETRNPRGEFFGDSRLDETLIAPATTAAEAVARVTAALHAFRAGHLPDDDETCVVCLATGASEEAMS